MARPMVTVQLEARLTGRYDCGRCGGQGTGVTVEIHVKAPAKSKTGGPVGTARRCEVCDPADEETPVLITDSLAAGTPLAIVSPDATTICGEL